MILKMIITKNGIKIGTTEYPITNKQSMIDGYASTDPGEFNNQVGDRYYYGDSIQYTLGFDFKATLKELKEMETLDGIDTINISGMTGIADVKREINKKKSLHKRLEREQLEREQLERLEKVRLQKRLDQEQLEKLLEQGQKGKERIKYIKQKYKIFYKNLIDDIDTIVIMKNSNVAKKLEEELAENKKQIIKKIIRYDELSSKTNHDENEKLEFKELEIHKEIYYKTIFNILSERERSIRSFTSYATTVFREINNKVDEAK